MKGSMDGTTGGAPRVYAIEEWDEDAEEWRIIDDAVVYTNAVDAADDLRRWEKLEDAAPLRVVAFERGGVVMSDASKPVEAPEDDGECMVRELVRVVVARPALPAISVWVRPTLETFQELVGGYVEEVKAGPFATAFSGCSLFCNEDGLLKRLTLNRRLGAGPSRVLIRGTFVVAKTLNHEVCSLTADQAAAIIRKLNGE